MLEARLDAVRAARSRLLPVVVLVSLVVLFSPRAPGDGGVEGLDKVVHAVLFAMLAVCTRWRYGRGLLAVLAYAVASELLQDALPIARDGSPADALADGVGAVAGWVLARGRVLENYPT